MTDWHERGWDVWQPGDDEDEVVFVALATLDGDTVERGFDREQAEALVAAVNGALGNMGGKTAWRKRVDERMAFVRRTASKLQRW